MLPEFLTDFCLQNWTIMAVTGASLPLNQEYRMSVDEKCGISLVMASRRGLKL
jgi:hypothetical protein